MSCGEPASGLTRVTLGTGYACHWMFVDVTLAVPVQEEGLELQAGHQRGLYHNQSLTRTGVLSQCAALL